VCPSGLSPRALFGLGALTGAGVGMPSTNQGQWRGLCRRPRNGLFAVLGPGPWQPAEDAEAGQQRAQPVDG
jgi:hypothetical protein